MDAIRDFASSPLPVRIVVLSSPVSKEQIVNALQLGARGILQKDSVGDPVTAIAAVLNGQYSDRRKERRQRRSSSSRTVCPFGGRSTSQVL